MCVVQVPPLPAFPLLHLLPLSMLLAALKLPPPIRLGLGSEVRGRVPAKTQFCVFWPKRADKECV